MQKLIFKPKAKYVNIAPNTPTLSAKFCKDNKASKEY